MILYVERKELAWFTRYYSSTVILLYFPIQKKCARSIFLRVKKSRCYVHTRTWYVLVDKTRPDEAPVSLSIRFCFPFVRTVLPSPWPCRQELTWVTHFLYDAYLWVRLFYFIFAKPQVWIFSILSKLPSAYDICIQILRLFGGCLRACVLACSAEVAEDATGRGARTSPSAFLLVLFVMFLMRHDL